MHLIDSTAQKCKHLWVSPSHHTFGSQIRQFPDACFDLFYYRKKVNIPVILM
jgi:hypothetical protein